MEKCTLIADLEAVCADIFGRWDADMRPGKLLTALEGRIEKYDPRVTRVRTALGAHDDLVAALKEMLQAIKDCQVDSPEIEGDPEAGIPPHRWHEQWSYRAEAALAKADPAP